MARLKLSLALFLAFIAPESMAQPQAIVAAAISAAATTALSTAAFTWTAFATAFAKAFIVTAISGLLSKPGKQQSQPSYQAEARDRLQVIRSAVDTRRIIYGQVMVSGPLVYAQSTGDANQYLSMVIALAGHECEEIGDIYFNDELVGTLSGVDGGLVTTGRFANYAFINKHLGAADQFADSQLIIDSGGTWTTAHRLRGICYLYIRLTYSADIFPNGIPNVKAVVKGKKLYDPRDGTTAWSDNWALCVRDYLTADYGLQCEDAHAPHYLSLPGTSGSYASTPDSSAVSVAGDIDIRVKAAAADWAGTGNIIVKRNSADCFQLFIASGVIQFYTSSSPWPTASLPAWAASLTKWVRVTRVASSGLTSFYWSDDGAAWNLLGSSIDSVTGPLNDTADAVELGAGIGGTNSPLTGKIYSAEIRNGIDGTVVAAFDAEDGENGDASIVSSRTGETWTINGSASLVAPAEGEVDDQALIAAANICDEMVATVAGSPSADQARYTCNGTINLADKPLDIMRQLMSAAAGACVYSQGQYRVFAGAYRTPTVDLDESDLRGGIQVQPRRPRRELYNGVRGTYADPSKFWQPTDFPAVTNSTYETQDGGQQILRDIELPFTTNSIRAQRIAKIHLEKSRQGITVLMPCKYTAFKVAVWDTVRLSIERLGWVNKVFIVTGWKFSEAGGIDLELQEEASAVYDWAGGDATTYDAAPDTDLPSPFTDLTITGLTAASGTAQLLLQGDGTVVPRIQLTWTAPGNAFAKRYELQFAQASGSPQEWRDAPPVLAPATSGFLLPVNDAVSYDCRVRLVTTLGNAGDWAYVYGHTVIGKTEVPSDVTGFSATQSGAVVVFGANTSDDADLDAIEIRLHDEGETNWDDASPVTNILRGQTATSAAIPPGTWELLAKNRDTSGNYSTTAARVTLTVTADGYTAIDAQQSAPDWQGAFTNMVKHWTGVLTPESQSLASALDWEVFDQFVPNAYADCYFEAGVVDKGIDASARIYADIISVLGPGETTGVANPALEIDTRLAAGSFDGFEQWTIGNANFRYVKGRIHVDTTIGKPVISGFNLQIDAASREESGTFTTPAGGSVAVSFASEFHNTPVLQVTPQGSGDVSASYSALTGTGFTGYFKTGGAAGAGTASYTATGA
jgi:hypothetical protein